jgi:hypothetical protein
MSTATAPVRMGSFFSLKLLAAAVKIGRRAVAVVQKGLKPCWVLERG